VSGADAAGGFAYQHAQATAAALKLAEDDTLSRIRVEADNDAIDLEIWSQRGDLVHAYQFKRRNEFDTWGQQELIDELSDWSDLGDQHPRATYHFVTDGRLGPTGKKVRDALTMAANDDLTAITRLMEKAKKPVNLQTMRRAEVTAEMAGYAALIDTAIQRAKALLPNVSGPAEADERSRWVALELLNIVTDRSGKSDRTQRFITRDEVLRLLATARDHITTRSWDDDLRATFIDAILSESPQRSVHLSCKLDPLNAAGIPQQDDAKLIEDWVDSRGVCLLGGAAGTGKSTALMDMQRRAAERKAVVLVADAEDYKPGRLSALMSGALNLHRYIGAHPATGNAVLTDPDVTIAIDGVAEIDADTRAELEKEIRNLVGADQRAAIVLAGRDTVVLRSVLHRKTPTIELLLKTPDDDQRRALIDEYFKSGPELAAEIVSQTDRAIGDVAKNPLMLLLAVRAMLLDANANNPARIFRTVVRSIATDNGYSNASEYEAGLGMAFNHLLDDGKRYCDSFTWTKILNDVAATLVNRGHNVTTIGLREFGFETGLVRVTQLDSVRPIHDSFADYLAGFALNSSASSLPGQLRGHDRARVRYLAGLGGVDDKVAALVTRYLPLTAAAIAVDEVRVPSAEWITETRLYLDQLLSVSMPRPLVAYWVDTLGRRIATANMQFEGWWDGPGPDGVGASGSSMPIGVESGPLQVAVRIWRLRIKEILSRASGLGPPAPTDLDDSVRLLKEYSDELHSTVAEMVSAIGISEPEGARLSSLIKYRLQFLITDTDKINAERDRGVLFREVIELAEGEQVLIANAPDSSWTGWGRVDSFITEPPTARAVRNICDAINGEVGIGWL
jgi:hypothetical protein